MDSDTSLSGLLAVLLLLKHQILFQLQEIFEYYNLSYSTSTRYESCHSLNLCSCHDTYPLLLKKSFCTVTNRGTKPPSSVPHPQYISMLFIWQNLLAKWYTYFQTIRHLTYISVFEISISSLHEMCCVTAVFLNISSIVFIFWRTSSQHVCLKLSDFIQFRMKFSSASILVFMVLLPAVISPMRFSMLANRWSNANFIAPALSSFMLIVQPTNYNAPAYLLRVPISAQFSFSVAGTSWILANLGQTVDSPPQSCGKYMSM